ncbi:MAG: class I poly(R)-hydroxyalkanoic acid synthase [Pseudomonadota bacterium]
MTESEDTQNSEPFSPYKVQDPEQLGRNILKVLETGSKAFNMFLEKSGGLSGPYSLPEETNNATKALGNVARSWMNDPTRFTEANGKLFRGYSDLWGQTIQRFLGHEVDPIAKPHAGDNRFQDPEWSENPFFDFWKQAYLLTSDWAEEMVETSEGIDDKTKQRAEFYLNLISSAFSPSNFLLTNPEVMRETLQTNGENLVKGMEQLTKDLTESNDLLKISQTDKDAFEVGKNLAVTPGKVIFQNDLIQLIQYSPATPKAYEIPLLIIPPWINKYYILDLVPKKSFVKWAVEEGFTVFMISWVNPDTKLSQKGFFDYVNEGVFTAVDAIQKTLRVKEVNTLGYCVGGTLLASSLAYMAHNEDNIIKSATFLTTQVDFSNAGDLMVFIDNEQLQALNQMMSERGYLDGSRMSNVFNFLRPKDLIWPYVVNNYLLGKKPFPFDLLYWNQDSTRMPAANHSFYLTEFYNFNKLAKKQMELNGVLLDLSKVKVPIYELATKEDHIAPAKSVYAGTRLFGGPTKFVLAGSGHIAGVINPPSKKKYQYWTNRHTEHTLDDWFEGATSYAGSWWPDWSKWLAAKSGNMIPASDPENGKLEVIEDAPGSYVREKA